MMRPQTIARALTVALLVAGTSILAAPEQTGTPGQMTQARVHIENRGRAEAVPISLQEASLDTPLRVRVVNVQSPQVSDEAIHARLVQQSWDYHTIVVKDGHDPVAALIGPGVAGWETTGVSFVKADGVMLLLKRPHVP
jgi:hypothetical protein